MSGMRPLGKLISFDKALSICESYSIPTDKMEIATISSAAGRVLAEDIKADIDVPPFARSAMDGYAVRAEDINKASSKNPVVLKIVEKIFAGGVPKNTISSMKCAEIATGGMLPNGANSIVMVEETRKEENGRVAVFSSSKANDHVILPGDDIEKGQIVGHIGDFLTPAKIGSLSAIGIEELLVYCKPKIVVMPTGDEIVRPGKALKPGQIYDVNTFTLSSAIESFGGQVIVKPIVDDSKQSLLRAIRSASNADIIIFSGGSSVGEKDLIVDAVSKVGELLFHGIAIRPGKPTLLGRFGNSLILGMPGHPTSCLSNAYIFLEPMVKKIGRYPARTREKIRARLGSDIKPATGRTTIMTVKIEKGIAIPAFKESSAITSMANADGYIVIPSDCKLLKKDSEVEIYLF